MGASVLYLRKKNQLLCFIFMKIIIVKIKKSTHYASALKADKNVDVNMLAESGEQYVTTPAV